MMLRTRYRWRNANGTGQQIECQADGQFHPINRVVAPGRRPLAPLASPVWKVAGIATR
jgi:hypothetical protein